MKCPAHPACTLGWAVWGALEPVLVLQVPSAQLVLQGQATAQSEKQRPPWSGGVIRHQRVRG